MIEYKGANIHVRQIRDDQYYAEWAWMDKASERKGGGTRKTELQAVRAAKQTIDAALASTDVCNTFFNRKLIG